MADAATPTAAEAFERLAPEARERLAVVRELAASLELPIWWAGGGVRDLLLGRAGIDLDLVVEAGAGRLALALAARWGGRPRIHRRFLTASLEADDGSRVDVATARREIYDAPAALPRVEPARIAEDLARRDFTVNAVALRLHPAPIAWVDPHRGLEDLSSGRLRILHPRSFVDDPTRILRGVRFETRLGFRFDASTAEAALRAVAEGHLASLSGDRLRAELDRGLEAWESLADAVGRLAGLGVWHALGAARPADLAWLAAASRLVRAQEAQQPVQTGPDRLAGGVEAIRRLLLVAVWLATALERSERAALGARLAAASRDVEAIVDGPARVRDLLSLVANPRPPLDHVLVERLERMSREERVLAAAGSASAAEAIGAAERKRRDVRLAISGDDLLAAGVPAGPRVGRALRRTREARLDGRLAAEEELAFALREASETGA